ncbi:MAG: glutamate 5-kinase, partial [Desulfovibrionales bacterium]
IVIKVGSAVLTDAEGLNLRVVNRLADQIASLHDKGREIVLVSSGAVAAGRKMIPFPTGEKCLPVKQAFSAVGQSRLMHVYDEAFERYKAITAQVLLTRDDLRSRERFLNARNTFASLLSWRVIPIVNENDTVAVQELKFGDNDALAVQLLNLVEADLFVNLTSAGGVFDDNPQINPDARPMAYIPDIGERDLATMCRGKTLEGTGGMYSKLLSARRAAQLGVPTLILSGLVPFSLEQGFAGEEIGTWIMPEPKAISRRKFWLAYNLDPAGEVRIDAGAAAALHRGKSLLPAGIRSVEGSFGVGALVRITDTDGAVLGVGLTNYRAADLKRIMGRKSSEIEAVLGRCLYTEAVHRDNMLLDAAV